MVKIPRRRRNRTVSQLLGDDPDINTLRPQLGSMGMSEAMGMNAFGNPGLASQSGKEHADVAILEGLAVE